MSFRAQFTDSEWSTLQFAPLWILTAIGSADGKIDEKESQKFSELMIKLVDAKDELVREVIISVISTFANLMEAYKADPRKIDVGLADVADILDKKAAGHADDFKKVMLGIGANIADASGPMLSGKVTDQEKMAFAICATALRAKL